MPAGLRSASLIENARLNALVIVPNAVKGLFKPRATALRATTTAGVDGRALGFLRGLSRRHAPGPVWVRVVRDRALLVLSRDDVRRVLDGSPDPFASDPETKRKGMTAFQPDALTISRGGAWQNRRRFTEAVLDSGRPHRHADRFVAVAREEAEPLLDADEIGWDDWQRTFRRIARRVILGDSAREDDALTDLLGELMSEANRMPGEPSKRLPELIERIRGYVDAAEDGSLAGLFEAAPADPATRVEGQVQHWLFATHDTLAINSFRCLALLATHPRQRAAGQAELRDSPDGGPYLEACLHEAMRLWPTTPMLARETVRDVDWDGERVPAGTQVLIVNTLLHRDPERHDFADRFAPEAWTDGDAAGDWSFNHLSHGPQGCPGSALALLLGRTLIARLLAARRLTLVDSKLDPDRPLPAMLDFFPLRFRVAPAR